MKKYLCMLLIGTMLLGSSGCSPKTVDTGPTDGSQNVGTEVSGLTTAESKDEVQQENTQAADMTAEPADDSRPEDTQTTASAAEPTEDGISDSAVSSKTYISELRPPGMDDLGGRESFPVYVLAEMEEATYALNAAGQMLPISGPEWYALNDVITGEPRYYACVRYEFGEKNSDDWDDVVCYSRLYDIKGDMVADWQPVQYYGGTGDSVLKRSYRYSEDEYSENITECLWNPLNDENLIDGADRLERVNDHAALCEDVNGNVRTIDGSAHVVASPPDGLDIEYAYANGGFIVALISQDGTTFRAVMDEYFNVLYTEDENSYLSFDENTIRGDYLLVTIDDIDEYKLLNTSDFTEAAVYYSNVEYFDGELAVVGEYRNLWLEDTSGRQLAGPYKSIEALSDSGRSDGFLVIDYEGNAAVIDRLGKVVASLEGMKLIDRDELDAYGEGSQDTDVHAQGVSIITDISARGGRIVYYVQDEDGEDWDEYCGLMDDSFNVLISTDKKYRYIRQLRSEDNGNDSPIVWSCRKGSWNNPGFDLYDEDVSLFFEGAAMVGEIKDGIIPVARGFYYGLIDTEGKWIAKSSKFTAEAND